MESPGFYPHEVELIEQLETHISKIFLAGDYVYKIKKPLDLGFLDFSTLEKRCYYCHQEVTLNRRLTHDIYLGVVPITLKDGKYALDGKGETVEYAVRMRKLHEPESLKEMISNKTITGANMVELGRKLAGFYLKTPQSPAMEAEDSWTNIYDACEENFQQTRSFSTTLLDREKWETIQSATILFLKRNKSYFINRFNDKKILDCHGDLRCDHIYFTDKTIEIIDCIEFNDKLRHIDLISDLAFLIMDLDFHGEEKLGSVLLNEFLEKSADTGAFLMLDFYKCYRAFVRCKVNCIFLASNKLKENERKEKISEALGYFNLSHEYALNFSTPRIWVICGMPATGKSSISKALAEILEVEPIQSDMVRKKLFGLKPHERGGKLFGEKIYSSSAGSMTYEKIFDSVKEKIATSSSIIVDATFSEEKDREKLMALAMENRIKPLFIECTAEEDLIKERLLRRQFTPSLSDARLDNFKELKARYQKFSPDKRVRHIMVDTAFPLDKCIHQILVKAFEKQASWK